MPAPLAVLKAAQLAKVALDKTGISPGVLVGAVAAVLLAGPIILVIALVALFSIVGINSGSEPNRCLLSMPDGFTVPANYSFALPAWDTNPADRDQTKDLNALPGPVPETYDNRGRTVPYLGYLQAAQQTYNVPWYVLAAISWQETRHGADARTWDRNQSPDHSYGPMQFIPGTWGTYGVDGDQDGRISDDSVGDQIFAAANLLVRNGFLEGTAGVLRSLSAYNPHPAYANDVLFWAQKYARGAGGTTTINNTLCNSLDSGQISALVRFVLNQVGKPYVWGTEGPDTFDCSGLMFAAFRTIGLTLPRRAVDEAGSDLVQIVSASVKPAELIPGDLLFIDNGSRAADDYSNRLHAYIGHVAMYIGNGEVVEAYSSDRGIIRSAFDAGRWSTVVAAGRVKGIVLAGGAGSGPWAAPVVGAMSSSGFGSRPNPTGPGTEFHNGQDLAALCGTPIYAVADGTVLLAGPASGYGNYLVVDHGGGFHTGYGHEQTLLVHTGDQVRRGQHIADVGRLGNSTGCHLHFNTVQGAFDGPWSGTYVDPRPLLIQHGVDYWGVL